MKRKLHSFIMLLIAGLSFLQLNVNAQGVTTSAISGRVTDAAGKGIEGVSVIVTHTPSGTVYSSGTRQDGGFNFQNVRVGGPYTLITKFIGYTDFSLTNFNLSLGQNLVLYPSIKESTISIEAVEIVSDRNALINGDRTGASTNVSAEQIQAIPTISRGLKDFTKLSPLANTSGNGTSFAGANNRYNQFSIDGVTSNDVFGLSGSGTNGGQTGIEPVSLDAIEQFQINIAPYDVRQGGFTGGGINAVTRSGSNTFQGSAYYFGNNEGLVGKYNPNTGVKADYPNYKDYQAGFRVGGPIIQNKLFFFLNGEITRQTTPIPFEIGQGSNIKQAEVDSFINIIKKYSPDYDLGSFGAIDDETNSNKVLGRIDWNINKNHKLTLRHSYTFGENIDNSRTANQLRFYNNGQYFPSTTNATGLEVNSVFGSRFSNNLLVGYTTVRNDRDPLGNPFPTVQVNLTGGRTLIAGSEFSSVANQLDQDVLSITDNFNFYTGKHAFTLGTNNEFYSFYNLFVQNIYGSYGFNSFSNFDAGRPSFYALGYSLDNSDNPSQGKGAADFSAMQLGLYAQDEYAALPNLKLTLGVRADLPIFNDSPGSNSKFNDTTIYKSRNIATDQIPESKVLISPRFGFNYDVFNDQKLQIRGGSGIFTGRVPFVWISNQYTNNGLINASYNTGTQTGNPIATFPAQFDLDPFSAPLPNEVNPTAKPSSGAINVTAKDFKFPQTFRSNLAVDYKLPYGIVATLEGIYSKTLNNVNFENLNRAVDTSFTFTGIDKRPRYFSGRRDANFEEVILLNNTSKGYNYNLVAQLQKQFSNGFFAMVAYTFGESKEVNPGTSSTAYSNWRFINNVNGSNNLDQSTSNFQVRNRLISNVSYKKEYWNKRMSTQLSVFYNGQDGQPLSYVYNGDLNNDGTNTNDLIYIPKVQSDINLVNYTLNGVVVTANDQWAALNKFIEEDKYLSKNRGGYAERNGAALPFQHRFDVRILQEFAVNAGKNRNAIQVSFDVINFGNLISKDWGKEYSAQNQAFQLIDAQNLAAGSKTASFQYRPAFTNGNAYTANDLASRFRGQFGVRYLFN